MHPVVSVRRKVGCCLLAIWGQPDFPVLDSPETDSIEAFGSGHGKTGDLAAIFHIPEGRLGLARDALPSGHRPKIALTPLHGRIATSFPVETSTRLVGPECPTSRRFPSCENRRSFTPAIGMATDSVGGDRSQSLILPPSEADATTLLSGENATAQTTSR